MSTNFLTLPIELRTRIYDIALRDIADLPITIYLELRNTGPSIVDDSIPDGQNYYTLPNEKDLTDQLLQKMHFMTFLTTSKQVYHDLVPIYRPYSDNLILRLSPGDHHNVPIVNSHDKWELVKTFVNNPRLSRFQSLTKRVQTVFSPVSIIDTWRNVLEREPLCFASLQTIHFYDNEPFEHNLNLFGRKTPLAMTERNREVVQRKHKAMAKELAKARAEGDLLSSFRKDFGRIQVTYSLVLDPRDGCVHEKEGERMGCGGLCYKNAVFVATGGNGEVEYKLEERDGGYWWSVPLKK